MRAATSVLILIGACVATAIVTASIVSRAEVVETTATEITHMHEAASTDFSAEASQLVVSRV